MSVLRGADIALARSKLQAEEAILTESLSAVRTQLNALVPVSRLPSELLEQIFGICVSWLYGHHKPRHRLAWTQVCHSWRAVSLASPRLWQCIDLCDMRLAQEFLVRSQETPISIVSASPLKLSAESLHIHAQRLRSIDVFLFPDDMVELFNSVGSNLSTLTSLSLKIPPVSSSFFLDTPLPSVRRLVLDCVAVQWDVCQNLTHLSLRGLTSEFSPTLHQLHIIFEKSPLLQYIRLESIVPFSDPNTCSEASLISLPHLREMIIAAKASVAASILGRVALAAHTRLQLYFSFFTDLYSLFPVRLPYEQDGGVLDVTGLRLARHAAFFLRPGARPWSDENADTVLSISSASCVSVPVMNALHTLLDLSRVTNLELTTGVLLDISSAIMKDFLLRMDNLEILRIAFNDLGMVFGILTGAEPESSSSYPARLICPRLTALSFSKPGDLWWHFGDKLLEMLIECGKARHLQSCPLQTVEFIRCHGVTDEVVKRLLGDAISNVLISENFESRRP